MPVNSLTHLHSHKLTLTHRYGGVSCLSTYDLSGDGVEEIVVGRDDGVVEVYSVDDSGQPRLKFTHVSHSQLIGLDVCLCVCVQAVSESVTGVSGGTVGSTHYEEVVLCTYSGRVVGLTRETLTQHTLSQEVS